MTFTQAPSPLNTPPLISLACSPPLPPLPLASPTLPHSTASHAPLADLLPPASQGNFLRQVEEEWGTLMFFADYRSKDRGQSVTPACTHAWLRRSATTPWATKPSPRGPWPRAYCLATSSPGLSYHRSLPPHGPSTSPPPLYLTAPRRLAPCPSRCPASLPQLLAAATSWDSPTPRALLLLKRLGRPSSYTVY